MRKILINANYGWDSGNRIIILDVPESEMDNVEDFVYSSVIQDITYDWEDITKEELNEDLD